MATISSSPTATHLTRQNSVIEKDKKTFLTKMAKCLKPCFKAKIINIDLKHTVWINYGFGSQSIYSVIFFAIMGVVIRAGTSDSNTFDIRFDDKCGDSATCSFPFYVKSKIEGPIFVYLHFQNFFVQHRNSLKSVSQSQLAGNNLNYESVKSACLNAITNEESLRDYSITGKRLDPKAVANPCGILASLFPKGSHRSTLDDFKLFKRSINATTNTETFDSVTIRTEGLSWKAHKEKKFHMLNNGSEQWVNVTNERFIEWMRAPLRSNFYKLWGIIDKDLEKGLYRFDISNGTLAIISRCKVFKFDHRKITCATELELAGRKQPMALLQLLHGCLLAALRRRCSHVHQKARRS